MPECGKEKPRQASSCDGELTGAGAPRRRDSRANTCVVARMIFLFLSLRIVRCAHSRPTDLNQKDWLGHLYPGIRVLGADRKEKKAPALSSTLADSGPGRSACVKPQGGEGLTCSCAANIGRRVKHVSALRRHSERSRQECEKRLYEKLETPDNSLPPRSGKTKGPGKPALTMSAFRRSASPS